ncbi:MAG: helix-turn-helix domain-containing protein [Synergistaceae bacterium]|nr:helix-turn-helix domain-containing protein [Synergistaceae bacterium]
MNVFVRFANILLEGGGIRELVEALHEETACGAAWKDAKTGEICCDGREDFCERATIYPLKELMRLYTFYEVHVTQIFVGVLLLDAQSRPPLEETVIESCLAAIRLFYMQKIARNKLESDYRGNLVQDLLYNRILYPEELTNRAKVFHWRLDGGIVCLVIALPDRDMGKTQKDGEDVWELPLSRIRAFFPQAIFSQEPASLVFLIPFNAKKDDRRYFDQRLVETLETICRDMARRHSLRILAAAGGYRDTPLLSHQSYQEARQALMILEHSIPSRNFVLWEQLGGIRLIATLADTEPARDFCRKTLHSLLQEKNEPLLKTLLCLEENNGNLRHAAQRLSIHYNTLKYRVAKIWELLEVNPEDEEERFNLSMAIRIYKLLGRKIESLPLHK